MNQKNLFRTVVSAMIAVLCTVSAVLMGKDVFADFMILSKKGTILLFVVVVAIALFFEYYGPSRRQKASVCVLLAAMLGFVAFARREILAGGSVRIANRYLKLYNVYYKTQIEFSGEGTEEEMIWTLLFFLMLLLVVSYLLAVLSDHYGILLTMPALMLSLELLVGYCPQWTGLFLFTCCAVLVCSKTWRIKEQSRAFAYLMMAFVGALWVSVVFLQKPAESISNKQDEMLAFQKKMEIWTTATMEKIVLGDKGLVDNHAPKYKNVEVLHFWTDADLEQGNVYLKGYYGTDYKNGRWYDDVNVFQEECKKNELESVAEQLARREYKFMQHEPPANCRITDKGTRSKYISLPNYTDPDSLKNYEILGNYEYKKSGRKKTWDFQMSYDNSWFVESGLAFSGFTSKETLWYEKYVRDHYLDGSDQIENIKYYAKRIKLETEWELGNDRYQMNKNALALAYAKKTAEYLDSHCEYTLQPQALPIGEEPIGFFLNESKEGYCVHFASAGTMLLRELGIPARYVGGYLAKANRKTAEDDGYAVAVLDSNAHAWVEIYLEGIGWYPVEMTPSVDDEADLAAASTEGGSGRPDSSGPQPVERPSDSENPQQPGSSQQPPTGEPGHSESESVPGNSHESETQTESESSASSGNGSGGNGGNSGNGGASGSGASDTEGGGWHVGNFGNFGGNGGFGGFGASGSGTFGRGAWMMAFAGRLVMILGIWLLAAYLLLHIYHFHIARYQSIFGRVDKELKRRHYDSAVFRMNRLLYRQLRKKGKMGVKSPSDLQYRDCLIRTYTQTEPEEWRKFIQTAEKSAFSDEGVTEDEAMYCRGLFDRHAEAVPFVKWRIIYLTLFVFTALGVFFLIF